MTKIKVKLIVKDVLKYTKGFDSVFTKSDKLFTTNRDIKPILSSINANNRTIIKYPVEIVSNIKPKIYKIALATVFDKIKNGEYKSDQETLERLLVEKKLMPTVFFSNRKKYLPCGIFYHRKNRLDIRILNQLLLFESIKMTLTDNDMQLIKNDIHTFAFYRQIYPDCYYLLVKTCNLNSRNYMEFQEKIEIHYANLIGSGKIIAKELKVAIPFSYDAALYHNTQSIPFAR